MSQKILKECLGMIDLTTLNTTDTYNKVESLVQKVNNFGQNFPGYPDVAAICVYPNFASAVKKSLTRPDVQIAVVGGVFPNSQSFTEVKVMECHMASQAGANEIDIVLSLNYFLGGDYEKAANEITQIKEAIGDAHLKVILETGAIKVSDKIYEASMLAMRAGADFIKTSTGKLEPAATPEAAEAMCRAIKDFYNATGKRVGFKPAGGIVTTADAIQYYKIVESILGEEWLNSKLFRIGASRLANNILSELESKEISYF